MTMLDQIRDHFGTYVRTTHPHDLDTLAMWTAHTHRLDQITNSARLVLTSALPGAGKTTALEHLGRLSHNAQIMSNAPTPALMARVASGQTLLIDEADTHVASGDTKYNDLFGIVNAGYQNGGTYLVLEQMPGGQSWQPVSHSVFGAVALAGINARLPQAFRTRCVFVHLTPDTQGFVRDTAWSEIGEETAALADRLSSWSQSVQLPPAAECPLPEGATGRLRDLYRPWMQIAAANGGDWPQRAWEFIERQINSIEEDRLLSEDYQPPHLVVLRDVYGIWHLVDPERIGFAGTTNIVETLHTYAPNQWGHLQSGGHPPLTVQGFGRMMQKHGIYSAKLTHGPRTRGYREEQFHGAWRALDLPVPHNREPVPS